MDKDFSLINEKEWFLKKYLINHLNKRIHTNPGGDAETSNG